MIKIIPIQKDKYETFKKELTPGSVIIETMEKNNIIYIKLDNEDND